MKKQLILRKSVMALLLFTAWGYVGCDKDDDPITLDPEPSPEVDFAISTVSGAWPDQTTYIQGVESLELTSIGNDNAIELTGSAGIVSFEGSVYATPQGSPANLVKYNMDANGIPVENERIVVPGANTFSTLYFESEAVAYGTVAGGISKLIVFDPSTMRITDEISLSVVIDGFPEATRTYYLDMLERDNKLFLGVHFENNFVPVNDSAYVAVIDLATKEVEKVLSDGRTGMIFGGHTSDAAMVEDANGDIYINALGTTNAGGNSPSGVLRIKSGQTEFDTDYFFNLEEVVGNISYGIYHTSSGRSFTARVEDATDFWEYLTGEPQFKYYEIDLGGMTSKGAVPGLPTTYGSRRMIIHELEDKNLLFTTATNDENAVYEFDVNSNNSNKMFVSTGGYITGIENLK